MNPMSSWRLSCVLGATLLATACSDSKPDGPVDTTLEEPTTPAAAIETFEASDPGTSEDPGEAGENLDGDYAQQPYGDTPYTDDVPLPSQPELEVREKPELLSQGFASSYPSKAAREEREGKVIIAVDVSAQGRVTNCWVASSSGSPDLDEAACSDAIRRARYRPATDMNGVPVATSGLRQSVNYKLN